jgi:hypothetical protein
MPLFPLDVSPELTAVVRAQQGVDRWRRLPEPIPLDMFVERVLDENADPLTSYPEYRAAVHRVAEAILAGRGHAFRNRDPLLEIARAELAAQPDLYSSQ